nr:nucleosome assembly protein 1 [Ipomoea batatas]
MSNPSTSNPNPSPAMNSDEDRVDASAARILRNQLLSFERGPEESFQSLNTSPKVQRRVIALREIQNKHYEFEVEYSKEKAALDAKYRKIYYTLHEKNKHGELEVEYTMEKATLDAKYQKIYYPLYQQRFKIVSGAEEVEGNNGTQNIGVEGDKDKGIPSFWLVAMKNNQQIAKAICEKDEGALAYLKDIEWSMVDTESFKIDFFFEKSNPFFSNPVLTKTYYMLRHEILLGTEGSLIEWYPGKSLTENTTRKKVIDKRVAVLSAKNKEPMTATEEESFSFFNFFGPLEVLMADHQVVTKISGGITIRDKIIPDALYWYTGEALEDDEDDDDYEDDEDEDDYEDDEDDDDYEDDEYEDDYEDDDEEDDYEDDDEEDDYEDDDEDEDDYEDDDEDEDYNDGNYQGKGYMDDDNASKTD